MVSLAYLHMAILCSLQYINHYSGGFSFWAYMFDSGSGPAIPCFGFLHYEVATTWRLLHLPTAELGAAFSLCRTFVIWLAFQWSIMLFKLICEEEWELLYWRRLRIGDMKYR